MPKLLKVLLSLLAISLLTSFSYGVVEGGDQIPAGEEKLCQGH